MGEIIEYEGAKYRKVERLARDRELIQVLIDDSVGDFAKGEIFTVRAGAFIDKSGDHRSIHRHKHAVLEPLPDAIEIKGGR